MAKPEVVRRIKSYSSATGFVYQYQFHEVKPAARGGAAGNEYIYYVSVDRKTMFPIRILVRADAMETHGARIGRKLTGTEEYAVAKMRLFQAFDELENFSTTRPNLVVDSSNLESLFAQLDL
ncbi:MAG: hypothetical protein WAK91_17065 [Candidatus Acidiferrales bacterium]|jgi:hypothetical protein